MPCQPAADVAGCCMIADHSQRYGRIGRQGGFAVSAGFVCGMRQSRGGAAPARVPGIPGLRAVTSGLFRVSAPMGRWWLIWDTPGVVLRLGRGGGVPRHAGAGGGLARTGPAKRIFLSCMLRFGEVCVISRAARCFPSKVPSSGFFVTQRCHRGETNGLPRHAGGGIAARRAARPWYTAKTGPAFEDMLTSLRRVMITARISAGSQASPTPQQIQEVLAAWHAAAA
jgi:hypothetical protein